MSELTREILNKLAAPFPLEVIEWVTVATNEDKRNNIPPTRALAAAYIDARAVAERLDEVTDGDWQFSWDLVNDKAVRGCLTVCGVTRCDVGERGDGPLGDTPKAMVSDALKRAAVLFGIGRYLYRLEGQWVRYDAEHRKPAEVPTMPSWALPKSVESTDRQATRDNAPPGDTKRVEPEDDAPSDGLWTEDDCKRFYARWGKLGLDDKNHNMAHAEFAVESMYQLRVPYREFAPLLGLLEYAIGTKTLALAEFNESQDIAIVGDWLKKNINYSQGRDLVDKYITKKARGA